MNTKFCRFWALIAVAVLMGGACGEPDNALWGSIDESFSLDFDEVKILKQAEVLRVEYLKTLKGGENKVCKVVLDTFNLTIKHNSDLGNEFFENETIVVERVASTGGDFPPIDSGHMHFDKFNFFAGGRMDGEFTVVFENGRNIFGNFDGKVKEVLTD